MAKKQNDITYTEARAALQYEDIKESTYTERDYQVVRVIEPRRGGNRGHVYVCYIFRGSKELYQAFENELWKEEIRTFRSRESRDADPYLNEGIAKHLAVKFES